MLRGGTRHHPVNPVGKKPKLSLTLRRISRRRSALWLAPRPQVHNQRNAAPNTVRLQPYHEEAQAEELSGDNAQLPRSGRPPQKNTSPPISNFRTDRTSGLSCAASGVVACGDSPASVSPTLRSADSLYFGIKKTLRVSRLSFRVLRFMSTEPERETRNARRETFFTL
jgi:hypothetical protein